MSDFCDHDFKLGDFLVWVEEDGDPENGVGCRVIQIDVLTGCIMKLQAIENNEALGKRGWFKETIQGRGFVKETWVKFAVEVIKN